jgi:hypothetical protein
MMHPEVARAAVADRRTEIARQVVESRRGGRRLRLLSRWRVNWSGTTFVPAGCAGGHGRSWVIVISARRAA